LGGVAAETLATLYGTPLVVIDTDVLDERIAYFAGLGAELGIDVAYAGKALLVVALARRLAASPLSLDVCSLGELMTAERAAFPAARLVMHGCAKTAQELRAVADGRVGRTVIDSPAEIASLAQLSDSRRPAAVLLRVNTGVEAHTHAHVRTGGEDTKFGLAVGDVAAAVDAVLAAPGLRLVGLHSHLGSQIFDSAPYARSLPVLLALYARAAAAGAPLTELVIGGGFGVGARPGDAPFDPGTMLRTLAREVADASLAAGAPPPRLGIEPGRAIVARSGTSLYRVAVVKRQGARRFAIVDGGIADNPRPALYGAFHEPSLAGRTSGAPLVDTTVCGRSCENDQLVIAPLPEDLRAGDLLALAATGAYTYSMASNYNRFPKPAVVFAGGGAHRLVVRRETSADVLRNDVESEDGEHVEGSAGFAGLADAIDASA
jgi:diaminopimelate decarboxylase